MGTFAEYEDYDALGLAGLVRRGEITAPGLLEASLERAEAHNPRLNAVIRLMEDEAARTVSGPLPDGRLSGVPFLMKDLFTMYAGVATTNGSRLYADSVPDHDSTITTRFKEAGLVIAGKTNTPELGISGTTEPVFTGPTLNPWDPTRSPGGSSGGGAAAVAAGIVPMAQASDGAGSIRSPASNCGLYGLKPTRARTPAGPDAGEGWSGLSTYLVVSRSVRDTAAALDALEGPEPGDPYAIAPPARPFLDEVGAPPGSLRVALWTEGLDGESVDSECVGAAENIASLLGDLGHEITPATPPVSGVECKTAVRTVLVAHTANHVDTRAAALGRSLDPGDLENVTALAAEEGRRLPARDYAAALAMIHRTGRQMARFFEEFDIVLSPTLADPPLPLGAMDMMGKDLDAYLDVMLGHLAFTPLYNLSGCPAASLPLHWTSEGLPVGVQVGAPFGDEATILRLSAQLEEAVPWWNKRPPSAMGR